MSATRRRLLVIQSAGEVADLADRCARWAAELDVDIEVTEPLAVPVVAARLHRAAGSADGVILERGAPGDEIATAVSEAGVPVVVVSRMPVRDRGRALDRAAARLIHGRGGSGFGWALRYLVAILDWPPVVHAYGRDPNQVGDLRVPSDAPGPLVVLLHGGFWRDEWERDLMDALAVDLARRGQVTWNVEYRRMGPSGGGWPVTMTDVAAALDAVPDLPVPVDPERVVALGHSAGGQLALWAAARPGLPPGAPGAQPRIVPAAVVALAPLTDLAAAARAGVGWGSVTAFLGDPERHGACYRLASPVERLPLGVPQMLVHGAEDRHVPPAATVGYATRAQQAGDDIALNVLPGVDHFSIIDPRQVAVEVPFL